MLGAQRSERRGGRQGLHRAESPHGPEKDSVQIQSPRGTIVIAAMPEGLQRALLEYDGWRVALADPSIADNAAIAKQSVHLRRLRRGLSRLTFRSVCRIATRHSHVCPVYVRGKMTTLTTLMGLFWWNDGGSTVRERLLLLAWRKGEKP